MNSNLYLEYKSKTPYTLILFAFGRSVTGFLFSLISIFSCFSAKGQSSVLSFEIYKQANFTNPVGITFDATGRAYVWEKGGVVKSFVGKGSVTTLLDISTEVMDADDHGLLGFALDPDFTSNGYFYLWYAVEPQVLTPDAGIPIPDVGTASQGRCTRYTVVNGTVNASTRKVLVGDALRDGPPLMGTTHGVGSCFFAADGSLMLSVGDGSLGDPYGKLGVQRGVITQADTDLRQMRAQKNSSLSGKLLRISKESGDGLPDNPFYNAAQPRSPESRMYVKGLRNPFRVTNIALAGEAGPGLFLVSDTGENAWEELALYNIRGKGGDNGGWPVFEGFDLARIAEKTIYFPEDNVVYTSPLYSWAHPDNARKGWGSESKVRRNDVSCTVSTFLSNSSNHIGSSSTANTFYPQSVKIDRYNGLLRNTVLAGDYTSSEIMGITFEDTGGKPNFSLPNRVYLVGSMNLVVCLYTNFYDGYIYAVTYSNGSPEISRLILSGNSLPVASISSDKSVVSRGSSQVQFYGDLSYDKESPELTYVWNFGDGSMSKEKNPIHRFDTADGSPLVSNVSLTVTDGDNASSTTTKAIFVNNTPPDIQHISVLNASGKEITELVIEGSQLPPATDVRINVKATDDRSTADKLEYSISIDRHHDNHAHYGTPIKANNTLAQLLPEGGCGDGATYWFEIVVKVTDENGATATAVKRIYQRCANLATQSITVVNPPAALSKSVTSSYRLNAYASSGLPVSFRRISGPIEVNSLTGEVSLTGELGEATIVVLQPGDSRYGNAIPVYINFVVDNSQPPIAFFSFDNFCTAGKVKFTNLSTRGGRTTYNWTLIGPNFEVLATTSETSPQFVLPYPNDRFYKVELTTTNSAGISKYHSDWRLSSACSPVHLPTADFTYENFCTGGVVSIENASSGGPGNTYSWKLFDYAHRIIATSSSENPRFVLPYFYDNYYRVELVVTNSFGASTKSSPWIYSTTCGMQPPMAGFKYDKVCTAGTATIINESYGGPGTTYYWTLLGPDFEVISTSSETVPTFALPYSSDSWYSIQLKLVNSQGTSEKDGGWYYSRSCSTTARVALEAESDKVNLVATEERYFIYPNPGKSVVNLSADIIDHFTSYIIYDASGAEVSGSKLQNAKIDISMLANGTYTILFIQTPQNRRIARKLVKQ